MPKSNNVSLFQEQKKSKPTVDELVQSIEDAELQHRVEEFVSFLKDCKMNPSWYATNSFNYGCKGKRVLRLMFDRKDRHAGRDNAVEMHVLLADGEELDAYLAKLPQEERDSFTKHKFFCRACGKCAPGKRFAVLGETYEGVCHLFHIVFADPTQQQLDDIKGLINACRAQILKGLA